MVLAVSRSVGVVSHETCTVIIAGASLNMSPLAIMSALVLWGSLWGMSGAVLAVPLLGIFKICLIHADHPLAKHTLAMVQEDPRIDEEAERQRAAEELRSVSVIPLPAFIWPFYVSLCSLVC